MSNQQRHVPLNSDSELESFDPVRTSAGAPSIAATQHVPLNSESEFEPSASNDDNDNDESESRGRRSGGGFAAQTGAYPEGNSGDDDDTLPPLSDARARSRTPRGARSKSRSRSRARHQGGLKTEVLMNSGSEESDGLTGGDGTEEERAGRPAGYVPQNSESDTDDQTRRSQHINTTYQTARSRSRSQNRQGQVRYQAPLNSESESDEVQTEYTTGPPSKDFQRLERIDIPMNEESERE